MLAMKYPKVVTLGLRPSVKCPLWDIPPRVHTFFNRAYVLVK